MAFVDCLASNEYGKERDKVTVNPCREVKQSKTPNGIIRYLDHIEEARLRKVLQSDVEKELKAGNQQTAKRKQHHIYEFHVAIGTGMRRSEQYGLTWEDVSFERREITLSLTKNGSGRIVHMINDVVRAMLALKSIPLVRKSRSADRPNKAPADAVFSLGDNKKWWADATRRAKVNNLRWHDLRHTFCSRLAQSGASIKIIQEAAGHKTIQMAARYAHLDKTALTTAMAVLNRSTGEDRS
jgi:integrase